MHPFPDFGIEYQPICTSLRSLLTKLPLQSGEQYRFPKHQGSYDLGASFLYAFHYEYPTCPKSHTHCDPVAPTIFAERGNQRTIPAIPFLPYEAKATAKVIPTATYGR